MSVYNIREKFSYVIATSSIDYIRNYNFNTSTISDIPIIMTNSDDTIPITVNITTTEPWMQIVDPISGRDVKLPNGNVVLEPSSSTSVLLKIDLPQEIESRPETVIYPNINLDIKSGSFPIISQTTTTAGTGSLKNVIVVESDIYYLQIGEKVQVNITVYDSQGNQDLAATVNWNSDNPNIVKIEEPQNTEVDYNPYTPRNVVGIGPGETTVTITADNNRTAKIIFRVREQTTTNGTSTTTGTNENNPRRTEEGVGPSTNTVQL